MKTGKSSARVFFFFFGLLMPMQLHGQVTAEGGLSGGLDKGLLGSFRQPEGVALESTIDPERYFVGPSDIFSVNIWVSPPVNMTLTVTPEGTLIIPSVGEVMVADLTLAEAKTRVIGKIKTRYIGGDPTVTLLTPRPLVATVSGNVLNAGAYVLAAYQRADRAIEQANKPNITQTQTDVRNILSTMSRRNIQIRHKDGSLSRADIPLFLATRDDRLNPYLREGDVIIVPRTDFNRSVVGIYGEVNSPGRYEFVQGDSLRDLIAIAHGFTPLALTDILEFSRLDFGANSISNQVFDGARVLAGTQPNVALQPGDRVVVRARRDLRADYVVTVLGEVAYPGTYPITKNSTRLSEIIAQAGGVTEFASLKTAELIRRPLLRANIELERLESLRGGVSPDDSSYYYLETDLRITKEPVNVDFERLLGQKDSTSDVVLADNDRILIPSTKKTVYVFGQVVTTGHVSYVPEQDAEYYIQKAGGFTERSRRGDVKIVKAKTRQWLSPGETIVEDGDYVWVPKEVEHPFSYYMSIIGQTASIISVAVSIVLLVIQVNK